MVETQQRTARHKLATGHILLNGFLYPLGVRPVQAMQAHAHWRPSRDQSMLEASDSCARSTINPEAPRSSAHHQSHQVVIVRTLDVPISNHIGLRPKTYLFTTLLSIDIRTPRVAYHRLIPQLDVLIGVEFRARERSHGRSLLTQGFNSPMHTCSLRSRARLDFLEYRLRLTFLRNLVL